MTPTARRASEREATDGPDLARLREPFGPSDIEWRVQRAGEKNGRIWALVVPYITARAIQDRLDDVCGPGQWQNEFTPGPTGGVSCGIGVLVDGEWVWKWDGASNTANPDAEVQVKGGYSAAFKRAAVHWGIGRYLYQLDEAFANVHDRGRNRGKTKEGKRFKWDPPDLPVWARPDGSGSPAGEDADAELRERIVRAVDALDPDALPAGDWKLAGDARRLAEDPDAESERLRKAAEWVEGLAADKAA